MPGGRGALETGVDQRASDVLVPEQTPHELVGSRLRVKLKLGRDVTEEVWVHPQAGVLEHHPADA